MVDFRIDVVVDPSRANRGARQVEDRLGRVENRADALRRTLTRAFAIFGGTALAFRAVRTLATFEQSLATVRAVTGATEEEFAALRDRAQELGITTRFTATQAGDALTNLARAGFSVQESLVAVEGTLLLAQAGGLGLAEASTIAASTLRGFRLEAEETSRVIDVLTLTANSANTTVGQLGEGLKFVAPVAAGLGQSLELTNAALGVLSDAGLRATMAGTGLRRVLAELEAPSSASQKILAELGVTADEVRVSQVGLVAALERLSEAGIDTGTALEFFGQRGGPAFEVLVSNIPRIRQLNGALEESEGVARRTADVIDDNLNGALLRARSALEGFILELGDAGATSSLTQIFENVARALRFFADNIEVTSNVLLVLSTVIVSRFIPALFGIRSALVLTNPAFAAFTVAAGAVSIALGKLQEDANAVAEAFRNLEEDSQFAQIGTQIRVAQQELNRLARIQERQGFLSESQQARVDSLTESIERLRGEAKREADQQREINRAREEQKTTVENTIAALDRQIASLREFSEESELAARAQEEVQKLLVAGQAVSPEEREAIENRIRLVAELEKQREVLESIRGPQQEAQATQAALNALLERGAITGEEFRAAMERLSGELEEVQGVDVFARQLESLEQGNAVLRARLTLGDEAAERLRFEQELRSRNKDITEEQVQAAVRLFDEQQRLNGALEAEQQRRREIQQEQARLSRLESALDLTQRQAQAERDLNAVLAQRPDLANQVATALENVRLAGLEARTDLEAGFERAFIKLKREAEDFAAVAEAAVNVFADAATDAIVQFVETGKFSFEEFASALLQELTRIIIRLLVVQAISAAVGAFGGGAAGAVGSAAGGLVAGGGGARQEGGTVQPGRSFLVGEQGPEFFIPDRTGTIQPAAQAAPTENVVQVINVQDPNEIPAAIAAGGADDAILNVIARNPDRVKQVIQ